MRTFLVRVLALAVATCRARSVFHKDDGVERIGVVQDADVWYHATDGNDRLNYVRLNLTAPDGPIQLELTPNDDLLAQARFFIQTSGNDQREDPLIPGQLHVLRGHSMRSDGRETIRVGDARIVIRSLNPLIFDGTFSVDGDLHHVKLMSEYNQARRPTDATPQLATRSDVEGLVMWRDSDHNRKLLKRDRFGLTLADDHSDVHYGRYDTRSLSASSRLLRRQLNGDTGSAFITQAQLARTIGSTAGCPTQRLVALVGAAADCNFVNGFNSTASARASIVSALNSASQVYESSFNITLGLASVLLSEARCPSSATASSPWNTACDSSVELGDRLSTFSAWRGNQSDSNAVWTLLTTCNTGSEIGVAWLGTTCNQNATVQQGSYVSGTSVVAAISSSYWRTLAHELGHNFGAVHDCTASACGTTTSCCPLSQSTCNSNGQYLMNPSSSQSSSGFSPCTVGQICTNLLRKTITASCLTTNQNVKLDGAATCGNGVVEEGEDCDCGGTAGCGANPCCEPTTCKFKSGAVCDTGNSACCTAECQFASNSTVCRGSTGQCDPEERCTGTSASCPSDTFLRNGQSCGTGLQCASGQCTSRDLQCRSLVNGSSGACSVDQSCALTCLIQGQCFIANQFFVSGTTCGNGGYCNAGYCDEGSIGHQIESWFDRNKRWLIPVIAVVGGLVVLTIIWSLVTSCLDKRRQRRKLAQEMAHNRSRPNNAGQYPAYYANEPWGTSSAAAAPSYDAPRYQQSYHH